MADITNFGIKGVSSSVRFGRRNGKLNFDNGLDSFKLRNIADTDYAKVFIGSPTQAEHAANKSYVDSQVEGLTVKNPVRASSNALTAVDSSIAGAASDVANISYNSAGDGGNGVITVTGLILDGVTLAANDRALIKDCTDQKGNGIYYVQSVAGGNLTLYRPTDAIGSDFKNGSFCIVNEGTVWADTGWVCTNDGVITINTTNITWARTDGTTTKIISDNISVNSSSTAGEVLISAGTDGTIPTWGPLDLTNVNSTTNTLSDSKGGTGQTSYTKGDILYADASGNLQKLAIAGDFNNRIISSNGGLPTWKYPYEIRHSASIVSSQVQTTSGVTVATVPAGARILRVHIDIVEAYQQDSAIAIGDAGDTDRLTAGEIWGTVAGTRHTYEIDYQYASETDVIATITNTTGSTPTPTANVILEWVVEA
jgi:hypothetical protein